MNLLCPKEIVPSLVEVLRAADSPSRRAVIARALGRYGAAAAEAVHSLKEALKKTDDKKAAAEIQSALDSITSYGGLPP